LSAIGPAFGSATAAFANGLCGVAEVI